MFVITTRTLSFIYVDFIGRFSVIINLAFFTIILKDPDIQCAINNRNRCIQTKLVTARSYNGIYCISFCLRILLAQNQTFHACISAPTVTAGESGYFVYSVQSY